MKLEDTKKFVPQEFSLELQLATRVLHLKSLHYGYWRGIDDITVDNFSLAQTKYTEKIVSWIPKKNLEILDVGAGIGDNAVALEEAGYRVTSLSPEPSQKEVFDEIVKKYENIKFIQTCFEDYECKDKYDVVLMSESSNYFPIEKGLQQVNKYLKKDGYLFITGMFRKTQDTVYEEIHNLNEYLDRSQEYGLKVLRDQDITDLVLPTLELGNKIYKHYGEPAIEVFSDFYRKAFPKKLKFLTFFFRKELIMLREALDSVSRRLDPELFKKHVTYRFMIFSMG
jgi:SAM-dependent methyltransferase